MMQKIIGVLLLIGLCLYTELQSITNTCGNLICAQATLTHTQLTVLEEYCSQSEAFESLSWYELRDTTLYTSSGNHVQGSLYAIGGDISRFGITNLRIGLAQSDAVVLDNGTVNKLFRDVGLKSQILRIDGKIYRLAQPLAPKGMLQALSQMEQYAAYINLGYFNEKKTITVLFHARHIYIARYQLIKLFEEFGIPYEISLVGCFVYRIRQAYWCIISLLIIVVANRRIFYKWRVPNVTIFLSVLKYIIIAFFVLRSLSSIDPSFIPSDPSSHNLVESLYKYAMYLNQSIPLPTQWLAEVNWLGRFILIYGILIGIVMLYKKKEKENEEELPSVRK